MASIARVITAIPVQPQVAANNAKIQPPAQSALTVTNSKEPTVSN